MKRNRILVHGEEITDDLWVCCGGPDASEALDGLRDVLSAIVEDMLANGEPKVVNLRLKVSAMEDEHAERLALHGE